MRRSGHTDSAPDGLEGWPDMLKHRFFSGILALSSVVLIANYIPPLGGWLLLMALAVLAQAEFYAMVNRAGFAVFRWVGIASGAALISVTFWTAGPEAEDMARAYTWEQLILCCTLLVMFVRQFPQKHNPSPLTTIACSLLGVWYVPFLFNYFTRLAFGWRDPALSHQVSTTGRWLIFYLVAVVKSGDIGAYFAGRALGRHKLFPRLSPNKTWEGFAGGCLMSLAISLLFWLGTGGTLGILAFGWGDAVVLGLVLNAVGVLGDLFESLIKRASNTKDSGSLVPGMGGLLDVLDSLLFGAPVLYAYARLFLS